jgi:glycosyltransferase involved in cell wall biosynthesis
MKLPWLSVIVPTYNGAAYLDKALASVACQQDTGVEVIAVDDGSTDATRDILDSYRQRLQLRVEARGRIGSWTANSNHGLRLARAEHACFLHQDDLWLPGRLRALRPLVHQGARAALLLHASQFVNTRGQQLGMWRCPLRGGLHAPADMIERLLVQNFIAIPAPVFSRQAALDVGGLDESLWYTADWDLWLKLAATGPTHYITKPLTAFRVHGESQTMQGTARAVEMRRQLEVVLDRHLARVQRGRLNSFEVGAAARLSVDVNHALADAMSGHFPPWWRLSHGLLALGLSGCHRYLRDSRILERVRARVRSRW